MYKCIFCIVIGLCLVGGVYGASLTVVDLPATDTDAAIGIDPGKTYTHAFDFGSNAPTVINGMVLDQGPTENVREAYVGISSQGYGYIIDDTRESVKINCHAGSDANDQSDGGSAEMLRDMIYFSSAVANEGIIITLQDLTPGTQYSVRYYYRAWDPELSRPITIIADDGETIDVDIDLGGAHYLDYTLVADDNDVTIEFMTNDDNQGVHLYGITCEEVPAALSTAAMVVANTDMVAGFDQAQKDRLESLGYAVTLTTGDDVKDGVFTAADAEAFDVLIVSESISSSAANNLIGANVPMMHQESYGWSRHFFTQGLNKVWLNDPNGMVDIVNDTHPIIADTGLSAGLVTFFTDASVSWTTDTVASLVPGAENLAQITNSEGETFTIIFAIEAGTELTDGSLAANRVVGFSLPGLPDTTYAADVMTDDAWAMFDAAIAWLNPPSPLLINGSFELPGTDKMDGFNGDKPSYGSYGEYEGNPLPAGPDTDVPGWTTDGETQDCGIQTDDTTDGEWLCFLRGGGLIDQGLWQLTEYVIEADDVIDFSLDAKHNWANEAYTITISVYYDDNGSRVTIASEDIVFEENLGEQGDWQTYTLTSDVSAAPEAVGKNLGVEIRMTGNYTFALIDNAVLEVN